MNWTLDQARDLYGIRRWGGNYFDLNEDGEVVVNLPENGSARAVSLQQLIEELRERGRTLPLILRFRESVRSAHRGTQQRLSTCH